MTSLGTQILWPYRAIALPIVSAVGAGEPMLELSDQTAASPSGAKLFEAQCSGCHIGGGNIVRRGKNLKLKTLQKNKLDTLESISTLVTLGKGNMSAYADRMTPEEIQLVSSYVLDQAHEGWKSP